MKIPRHFPLLLSAILFWLALAGVPVAAGGQPKAVITSGALGAELQLLELDGSVRTAWGMTGGLRFERWEAGVFGSRTFDQGRRWSYRSGGFTLTYFQPALSFLRVGAGLRIGWSTLREIPPGGSTGFSDQLRTVAPLAGVEVLLLDEVRIRVFSAFHWVSDADPLPEGPELSTLVNSIGLIWFPFSRN